jgi:hypothetical protein
MAATAEKVATAVVPFTCLSENEQVHISSSILQPTVIIYMY